MTNVSHRRRKCLVLRDISSTETDADEPEVIKDHVTSGGCANDVNVLDVIETCYGDRPILLSNRFINRRLMTSGKYPDTNNV